MVPSTTNRRRKPWAVLAYTVADDKGSGDSLDATAKAELAAICDAADFGQVSVAAQVDFKHTRGIYRGALTTPPKTLQRFVAAQPEDHPLWRAISSRLKQARLSVEIERTELNAARSEVLAEFLRYGQRECPAERYLVFFYGHASGPMGLFYDSDAGRHDPHTLRLNDLASSLDAIDGHAALVVFRDCFMNTLETAYQLRGVADYMVASQGEAPIAGVWPWVNFMATLMPGASSADIGRAIVLQLARFLDEAAHRGKFADVPYSLIDLGASSAVVAPMTALVSALESARANPRRCDACARAIAAARIGYPDDPAHPGDPALLDVLTLCDRLAALDDEVSGPARALAKVVSKRMVLWHHSRLGAHRGISVYCRPTSARDRERSYIEAATEEEVAKDAACYARLAFCRATGWHRIALNPLVAGTARRE